MNLLFNLYAFGFGEAGGKEKKFALLLVGLGFLVFNVDEAIPKLFWLQ
jgi:hypothetical protein